MSTGKTKRNRRSLKCASALLLLASGPGLLSACATSGSTTSSAPVSVTSTGSSPSKASIATPNPSQSGTPAHTLKLSGVAQGDITVPSGQTMTIDTASTLAFGPGSRLVVRGTLVSAGPVTMSGSGWGGITVAGGGQLDLSQAKITGAINPITVDAGGRASLTNVTIADERSPFTVAPSGSLTLANVKVAQAAEQSSIDGTLHAVALDYNKGAGEGFTALKGTAKITLINSHLHGDGPSTGDMLSMRNGDSLTVVNSDVTGAHCAFHILGLNKLLLDHANIHENSYGFMMYGTSTSGTRVIKSSNIQNNQDFGIDEGSKFNHNGPIRIEGSYIANNGQDLARYTSAITVTNPASAPIRMP